MTPHFEAPDMLVSVRVIEFNPSITEASDPVAVNVESVTVNVPVQYIPGEPSPVVPPLQFDAIISGAEVPVYRSVASAAQWAPEVLILEFVTVTVPPYVASTPRDESAVVTIVTWSSVSEAFAPNAKAPFEPVDVVFMVQSVMLMEPAELDEYAVVDPDDDASTPAFTP